MKPPTDRARIEPRDMHVRLRDGRARSNAARDLSIAVFARAELATDLAALTAAERDELARLHLRGPRAAEWLAGRVAAHRLLGEATSVVTDADGAPRVVRLPMSGARDGASVARDGVAQQHALDGDVSDGGAIGAQHVSLSHDGDWLAVAVGARPIAIDLCTVEHAARVERILARLGVVTRDPLRAWTALECALKLRRRGVWTLLDRELAVEGDLVTGIGAPVRVAWHVAPAFVVAWSQEAA